MKNKLSMAGILFIYRCVAEATSLLFIQCWSKEEELVNIYSMNKTRYVSYFLSRNGETKIEMLLKKNSAYN